MLQKIHTHVQCNLADNTLFPCPARALAAQTWKAYGAPPMHKSLWFITGLLSFVFLMPVAADAAAPYCGERICHSYDSSGACDNYTCLGWQTWNPYKQDRYYENSNTYRYDPYNRYATQRSYYYNRYPYYEPVDYTANQSYRLPYRMPYYNDNYYYDAGRSTDRVYVPKAGYYYRY
jgi:hypothetical protein